MRFASIVGTRPQFVKLAPVSEALRQQHEEIIIHTGQHYDYNMSAQFFDELAIPVPDYHLEIGSGTHGAQTARMLEAIEQVLLKERPDQVVVFGDTNSTLAGALAAAKLHMPVAHVEAGLRSFNRAMPEEINRIVVDHLSERLFCPTETAQRNAAREGIVRGVEVVGDVMYDILLQAWPKIGERARELLPRLGIEPQHYVLVTVHRAANTDDRVVMCNIAHALNKLEMPVVFPVHPRTRAVLERYGIVWEKHVQCIDPEGYIDMLTLEANAITILTDSGGVQKEAFLLRVPCATLREETEWVETVESGWNVLVGTSWEAIMAAVGRERPDRVGEIVGAGEMVRAGTSPAPTISPAQNPGPFGRGDAARRIASSWSS